MREIKFRAWNGIKMLPVSVFTQQFEEGTGNGETFYMPTRRSVELANGEYLKFDPMATMDERIMQYTGLKDKNGKEIYEGDIWEPMGKRPFISKYIVEWDNKNACWKLTNTNPASTDGILIGKSAPTGEVIGNIYENPELLKGKS